MTTTSDSFLSLTHHAYLHVAHSDGAEHFVQVLAERSVPSPVPGVNEDSISVTDLAVRRTFLSARFVLAAGELVIRLPEGKLPRRGVYEPKPVGTLPGLALHVGDQLRRINFIQKRSHVRVLVQPKQHNFELDYPSLQRETVGLFVPIKLPPVFRHRRPLGDHEAKFLAVDDTGLLCQHWPGKHERAQERDHKSNDTHWSLLERPITRCEGSFATLNLAFYTKKSSAFCG